MSNILGITVRVEGTRVRFHFDQCAADEVQSLGEVGPDLMSWSDELTSVLTPWDGVTEVELAKDGWSLAFSLRPGVSLERAIRNFLLVFTHYRSSLQHVIVHM